jgi:UDP-N-acetylenolpyruvoylglucosamine reductase
MLHIHPASLAAMDSGTSHVPTEIRSAVISIRMKKLPDPTLVPDCGSLFTNPILSQENIITALRNSESPLRVLESGKHKNMLTQGLATVIGLGNFSCLAPPGRRRAMLC